MNPYLLCLALITSSLLTLAQDGGELDPTFDGDGFYIEDFGFQDNLMDVKVQPDGKIITCGTALTSGFAGKLLVMRQNPDGTPDLTFNETGHLIVDNYNESYAYEIAVREDGKILIAGASADPNYLFSALVIRLENDGTPDPGFGNGGFASINTSGTDHFAYGMRELNDGRIALAGTLIDANFNQQPVVIMLMEDGSLDDEFGNGGVASIPVTQIDNRFNAIDIQDDGKIIAAGHYGNPITNDGQFDFDFLIARFNPDGTPDVNFGTNGYLIDHVSPSYIDDLFDVIASPGGEILATGFTTQPDFSFDAVVMKYDSSGERVPSFGNNGVYQLDVAAQDVGFGIGLLADNKILFAGTSGGFFFDNRDILLVSLLENGTPDPEFTNGGIVTTELLGYMDEANSIAIQNDGKIVVAGKTNDGTTNDICIVRYYGQQSTAGVDASASETPFLYPNPASTGQPIHLAGNNKSIDISVFDAYGRTVFTANTVNTTITPGLVPGVYHVHFDNQILRLVIR